MKINVTCVQMEPFLGNFHKNLEKMCLLTERAMSECPQTDLIVFPELITTGYECGKSFRDLSETVPDGLSMRIIGALAKEYKIHIVYGFPEQDRDQEDVLYNSAVLIDDNGEMKGVYRKVHLFSKEREYFRSGDSYPVFDTSLGRLGIMICWDAAFPEVARSLALKGADLLVVPMNWEREYITTVDTSNQKDWNLVTRARAMDNCMYLVSANRVGYDKTLSFFGRSCIIGPAGDVISELADEDEGLITAELDYSLPAGLRSEYYTYFEDRRPETYSELTKKY